MGAMCSKDNAKDRNVTIKSPPNFSSLRAASQTKPAAVKRISTPSPTTVDTITTTTTTTTTTATVDTVLLPQHVPLPAAPSTIQRAPLAHKKPTTMRSTFAKPIQLFTAPSLMEHVVADPMEDVYTLVKNTIVDDIDIVDDDDDVEEEEEVQEEIDVDTIPEPSNEDKKLCRRPSIPRIVELDRLLILLEQFKNYENVRWPAKPEQVYCDKVVMAIRGCSSITKNRQDEAIRKGAAKPLVEVLTGVHLDDRETCLRTTQCILGICTKNEKAVESFRAAGAGAALRAVLYQHRDSNSKDFQRAVALFLKDADKHSEHSRLEDELELIRSSSKASIGA